MIQFFSPRSRYRHCPNSGEKGNAGPGIGSGPCGGAGCARRGVEQDPKGPVAWQRQRSSGGDGESGIEQLLQGTWRGTERRAGRGGGRSCSVGRKAGLLRGRRAGLQPELKEAGVGLRYWAVGDRAAARGGRLARGGGAGRLAGLQHGEAQEGGSWGTGRRWGEAGGAAARRGGVRRRGLADRGWAAARGGGRGCGGGREAGRRRGRRAAGGTAAGAGSCGAGRETGRGGAVLRGEAGGAAALGVGKGDAVRVRGGAAARGA